MWMHYLFSDMMYPLVYYIVRYRRKIVRKNLTRSFPEKDLGEIKRIERRFYRFFCDYFVENIKALTMSKQNMQKRIVFSGEEAILHSYEKNNFIILYLGHFCNWEYVASVQWWLPEGVRSAQLYSKLHNKAMDRLFYNIRSRYGGININKKESLRRIMTLKQSGGKYFIGFVSDQAPKRENIHLWVDFLNQDTPVFTGAERIAKKIGASVYYAKVTRISRGHYHCDFQLITDDANQYKEHELTLLYMKMLEEDVRHDPARWLWSHNRWKRQRTDTER
ncbi:MAG: lysophospholipid acyltransferase family protein [Bacteroidaceae bacterium]|nr:lysophospholipid acyltransferase family protein [Bacteroidaceae bacterium]